VFRLDRTAFRINTFAEADNNCKYWLTQPVEERLRAANFLIRQAYGIDPQATLRMDRSHSVVRIRRKMNNLFNQDFLDLFKAFNTHEVEYILVGGYAVILHGYNRSTGDLDLWVAATAANYQKIASAFQTFGMPLFDMSLEKFLRTSEYDVFTFGVSPVAVDLITNLKGLNFSEAYNHSSVYEFEDVEVRVVQYADLITAKRASGRNRDLNDIEQLEKGRR
jgi:hypothetical protein